MTTLDPANPQPGIYPHVPSDEYFAAKVMSQSVLKHGMISAKALRHALDHPVIPTDAMNLGSALHCAFLEPDKVLDRVTVFNGTRRGATWDAFEAEHSHMIILTQKMYAQFQGMMLALRADPNVKRLMARVTDTELAGFQIMRGVMCRGRADAITPDAIVDVKSVASTKFNKFITNTMALEWHIKDEGAALQGAMYRRIFERERFILVVVESSQPHDVAIVEVAGAMLDEFGLTVDSLLRLYKRCTESGDWPGAFPEPVVMEYEPPVELILDEGSVKL